MVQEPGALPSTVAQLITTSSLETRIVLVAIGVFSLAAWFIIFGKWWQLRRLNGQARRFFVDLERSPRLHDAYRAAMKLPPSPYTRLFREGISFYSELRPGALGGGEGGGGFAKHPEGPGGGGGHTLSESQLEALKMVLGKEVAAERDGAGRYVSWLATIGSVSPLLGLLGTVLGVMDAFLGISVGGSGNIAAVAPGVAEALVTTVAGLGAAIPAVIGYNYFANRIMRLEGELEGFGNELIGWMAREGLL